MKNNKLKLIGLLCAFIGLTACNSGGPGSNPNTTGTKLNANPEVIKVTQNINVKPNLKRDHPLI